MAVEWVGLYQCVLVGWCVLGAELYLWLRNLFIVIPEHQVKIWVRVRVTDVGLDPLPNCGRIDLHLACSDVQVEARWLTILTEQVDAVRSLF